MKLKNYFLILITLFITIACKRTNDMPSHKISEKIQKIVDSLSVVNFVGYEPEKNIRFQNLDRDASIEDLVFLTDYKVPEIRCFAFYLLQKRNYPKIKEIFYKHIKDKNEIVTGSGCLIHHASVMYFMLQQLHPNSNFKFKFDKKEFDKYFISAQELEKNLIKKKEIDYKQKVDSLQNLDLLYTQEYYWSDSTEPDFEANRKLVSKPIKWITFDDNVLATAYFEVNGCNSHYPNCERKGDTLVLKNQMLEKHYCGEKKIRVINKINFVVFNQYINKIKYVVTE